MACRCIDFPPRKGRTFSFQLLFHTVISSARAAVKPGKHACDSRQRRGYNLVNRASVDAHLWCLPVSLRQEVDNRHWTKQLLGPWVYLMGVSNGVTVKGKHLGRLIASSRSFFFLHSLSLSLSLSLSHTHKVQIPAGLHNESKALFNFSLGCFYEDRFRLRTPEVPRRSPVVK